MSLLVCILLFPLEFSLSLGIPANYFFTSDGCVLHQVCNIHGVTPLAVDCYASRDLQFLHHTALNIIFFIASFRKYISAYLFLVLLHFLALVVAWKKEGKYLSLPTSSLSEHFVSHLGHLIFGDLVRICCVFSFMWE